MFLTKMFPGLRTLGNIDRKQRFRNNDLSFALNLIINIVAGDPTILG